MNETIKLLKDWHNPADQKQHKAGAILEVDPTTAKELIAAETAEKYDADAAGQAQKDAEAMAAAMEKAAEKIIDEKLSKENLAKRQINITVKDLSDDDPYFGYAEGEVTERKTHLAFGHMARDILAARSGREPEKLMKCRERTEKMLEKAAGDGLVVSDDEFGGYMIFPAAMQLITDNRVEAAVIRPRARRFTMGTQTLRIPMVRDENRTNGQIYNGIRVYWEDELDQGTASRPKLRMVEMKLKKLMALGHASGEWMKWSPVSIGSWFIPMFGQALGYTEDIAFINGKGGGQPLGLLNSLAKVEVAKEDAQDADTIVLENTTKMRARLRLSGAANIVWLANQTIWPQLPLLNFTVGLGGVPAFTNDATADIPQRLWGYPLVFTEKTPVLGDAGDLALVALNDYVVADDQSGPEVAQSAHLKFDYDQETLRVITYVDGQNLSDTPFTPYQAGDTAADTLSPVVTLAERA